MDSLTLVSYLGVFVFSCTGALKARAHHMDIFGGFVMALVMGFGGGTSRDLLIGRPVSWVNDNWALGIAIGGTVFTFLFKRGFIRYKKVIFLTDALGLGLFTYLGIGRALMYHLNEPFAVLMGVVTATFGGLIADIISNSVPALLRKGELYATASAIGGTVYILLRHTPVHHTANLLLCILLVVAIRIISKWKNIMLPGI